MDENAERNSFRSLDGEGGSAVGPAGDAEQERIEVRSTLSEPPADSHLLERALRLAASAHAGQSRKGSDLPYITHPVAVALILARAGFVDEELLAAALLHDVVEDTPVELADLEQDFSDRVCEYVAAASEQKSDATGRRRAWSDRKADHVRQVAAAPLAARAIVLADKLHNLQSMLFDLQRGTGLWERFNAGPRQIIDYHRQMITAAARDDDVLRPLADLARDLLDRLESATPD